MGQLEKRSADGEDFAARISELQEEVKARLQKSNASYKARVDSKRREKNYEVGDLVLAHLRRERFPKGEYDKLKMKKIGPGKVLRKFSTNAYELEMPTGIGIPPIFNVADIYPFVADDTGHITGSKDLDGEDLQSLKQMPKAQPLEVEKILDTKVVKSTIHKDYLEYLIMWKTHPVEDATWMSATELEAKGFSVADLMNGGSLLFTPGVCCRSIRPRLAM